MYNQPADILESNNILLPTQTGFRAGCSTDTAVVAALDELRHQADKGRAAGLIFLDILWWLM